MKARYLFFKHFCSLLVTKVGVFWWFFCAVCVLVTWCSKSAGFEAKFIFFWWGFWFWFCWWGKLGLGTMFKQFGFCRLCCLRFWGFMFFFFGKMEACWIVFGFSGCCVLKLFWVLRSYNSSLLIGCSCLLYAWLLVLKSYFGHQNVELGSFSFQFRINLVWGIWFGFMDKCVTCQCVFHGSVLACSFVKNYHY